MKLFDLFTKKKIKKQTINETDDTEKQEWEVLPPYLPVEREEHELVSVIVSAIAAADHLKTRFKIKKILKRNPEFELVTVITAASVVRDDAESQFKIKNILKKKEV